MSLHLYMKVQMSLAGNGDTFPNTNFKGLPKRRIISFVITSFDIIYISQRRICQTFYGLVFSSFAIKTSVMEGPGHHSVQLLDAQMAPKSLQLWTIIVQINMLSLSTVEPSQFLCSLSFKRTIRQYESACQNFRNSVVSRPHATQ